MEYAAGAPETMEPFGAEFIFRGKDAGVLIEEHAPEIAAIVRFPDYAALTGWYESAAYKALAPIRDEGGGAHFCWGG